MKIFIGEDIDQSCFLYREGWDYCDHMKRELIKFIKEEYSDYGFDIRLRLCEVPTSLMVLCYDENFNHDKECVHHIELEYNRLNSVLSSVYNKL